MSDVEVEYEPVTVIKYHLQIRAEEAGRAKGDGRRGRVLFDDEDCPYEVIRWLKSGKCKRATGATGKKLFIWINDELLPDNGAADPNEATEETSLVPAPRTPAEVQFAIETSKDYIKKLEALADAQERQLASAKAANDAEIASMRKARDAELAECERQISASRARVTAILKEEEAEMAAVAERRRAMSDERSQIVQDSQRDAEAVRDLRDSLGRPKTSIIEQIAELSKGITGTAFEPLIHAGTAYLLRKSGVKIPADE